ncbi:MAG: hypothetical protein ACYCOU_01280 [Sulfobacillus sp.]
MGCDIHVFLERRVHDRWVMVKELDGEGVSERNYKRFAALAGVRGDGPKPRGLPIDVSESTNLHADDWGTDGHSHSWLPVSEAAPIFLATGTNLSRWAHEDPITCFFGERAADDPENHRIVFWFDN